MFGLRADDLGDEPIEVWEENWDGVSLFVAMQTQWNVGTGGPIGLRYEALPVVFMAFGVQVEQQRRILHDLQVMETEALSVIYSARH